MLHGILQVIPLNTRSMIKVGPMKMQRDLPPHKVDLSQQPILERISTLMANLPREMASLVLTLHSGICLLIMQNNKPALKRQVFQIPNYTEKREGTTMKLLVKKAGLTHWLLQATKSTKSS